LSLPPLQSINDSHFYISGDVTIHPSAAIAPGVMLQADPDSHLIVAAGVCIGTGSVLHAHQGILLIDVGATLGSGVLILGSGRIGANACIGPMTTILDTSIEPHQSVPSGSLIGDGSRQLIQTEAPEIVELSEPPSAPEAQPLGSASPQSTGSQPASETNETNQSAPASEGTTHVVYGRAYLEKIMITMFPHRQQ
jgi:carbon dioxide concentrating mechanism protein CcmN